MNDQIQKLIGDFNDETNAIAAKIDALNLAAGLTPTPEQISALQGISDRLKQLGSDPSNPVPASPQ